MEFPGACLYVTVRSGRGLALFSNDKDRAHYLCTAGSMAVETGHRLLAYCLLDREIHLVIKSGTGGDGVTVSAFMKSLNQRFSRHWGRRHGSTGHLFAGRFRSLIVDENRYLLPLVAYLHRLPEFFPFGEGVNVHSWTSDEAYRGGEVPVPVDTGPVRELLLQGSERPLSECYQQLMEEAHGEMALLLHEAGKSGVLGGKDFIEREPVPFPEGRPAIRLSGGRTLNELIEAVKGVYGVSEAELIGRGRKDAVSIPREVLSYLAVTELRRPVGHVALYLRRDQSLVSRIIRKMKRRPEWQAEVGRVREFLARDGTWS